MTEKNRKAKVKYWSKQTSEAKAEKGRAMAEAKHKKMTEAQKKEQSRKMLEARWNSPIGNIPPGFTSEGTPIGSEPL